MVTLNEFQVVSITETTTPGLKDYFPLMKITKHTLNLIIYYRFYKELKEEFEGSKYKEMLNIRRQKY